jgi:hypothetical protein
MCLIKQPSHGDVWGTEGAAAPFLNSALASASGGNRTSGRPARRYTDGSAHHAVPGDCNHLQVISTGSSRKSSNFY